MGKNCRRHFRRKRKDVKKEVFYFKLDQLFLLRKDFEVSSSNPFHPASATIILSPRFIYEITFISEEETNSIFPTYEVKIKNTKKQSIVYTGAYSSVLKEKVEWGSVVEFLMNHSVYNKKVNPKRPVHRDWNNMYGSLASEDLYIIEDNIKKIPVIIFEIMKEKKLI